MVNFRLLSWFWNIQSWKMASQINSLNMASKSSFKSKSVWSNFIIHWNELRRIFCCQLPRWTFFVSWESWNSFFLCVSTLFISRDSWCRFWRHFLKIKGHFNLHKVWKIGFFFKLDFFEWFFWSVYYYFVTKLIFSMMIEVKKSDMEVKYEVGRDHTR